MKCAPAILFRAHQVGYSWIVWCEACPTSFSEILSPLHHEVSRPQIFLTACFEAPYYEDYTGRTSVPPGGAGKDKRSVKWKTSTSPDGCPPARSKTLNVGASPSPSSSVEARYSSGRADEPPLEVLPISVWSPTAQGAAPPPTMANKVMGNRDRSEAAGDPTLCFLMRSSPLGLLLLSCATPTSEWWAPCLSRRLWLFFFREPPLYV